MTTVTSVQAIRSLRPGASWTISGDMNTYANLDWKDQVQVKPTEAEIIAEMQRLQGLVNAEEARISSFVVDAATADLINKLKTSTPAQIDAYLATNWTTITNSRAVGGLILKCLVLMYRDLYNQNGGAPT